MTLDDAAAALDVTENHLKDLIRDGKVRAKIDKRERPWRYDVQGKSVRARRKRLNERELRRWR